VQQSFDFAAAPARELFAAGAWLLRGFALPVLPTGSALLAALHDVIAAAPLRHMVTPGGHRMSVAMTNCGAFGWVSDERGYRYTAHDPASGAAWPALPPVFAELAARAAAAAGYAGFAPDACLVNRYEPGARMTLHQDKNERDFGAPIVSVSLGLPVVFQFGGLARSGATRRLPLAHGDVAVWGGPSRLCFHGVLPLRDGVHAQLGRCRVNLTLRVAG
jgi:alkylated DNA repair protein (DNA oxidative demethylase)